MRRSTDCTCRTGKDPSSVEALNVTLDSSKSGVALLGRLLGCLKGWVVGHTPHASLQELP